MLYRGKMATASPHPRSIRLAEEKKSLHNNFKDKVRWIDPAGRTKVEVEMVSNSNRGYILRLYIPDDFPNSCPKLVVVTPVTRQNGESLPENSREFHTLESHEGYPTICHYHPNDWQDNFRLFQVFIKGRLWIEAYEGHLETGENLDYYLRRHSQSSESLEWTPRQSNRLAIEKEMLANYYPGRVKWNSSNEQITIEVKTNNENLYRLRVFLPSDYPSSIPTLAVVSPRELKCKNGEALPDSSPEFRTLQKREDFTTICHFLKRDWTEDISIDKVFTKGEIWVKAYDNYILHRGEFLACLDKSMQCSEDHQPQR